MGARTRRGRGVVVAALVVLPLAGCTSEAPGVKGSGSATAQATGAPTGNDDPAAATTGPADRGPDPTAPATPSRVIRDGAPPADDPEQPSERGDGIRTDSTVVYPDGLRLAIVKVSAGEVTDTGAGAMHGEKFTRIELTVTNGSKEPVDATRTVTTLTYGSPARSARPVYEPDSRDLAEVIEPGGTAKATYSFAIPADAMAAATLSLDIDNTHDLATFAGAVS